MGKHKNHSKLLIPILLLFLSSSGLLFCQQPVEGNININSDYEIFREEPENDLFPHLQISTYDVYNLLSSTIDLLYTKIDQLCTDSLFLIDTIYFHEKSHFKDFNDYRRSFTYDKFNRIKTVVVEAYKDSHWVTHQITDVSYNSSNKVEQINHIRYQKSFDDSLIIKNEFDSAGLIIREVGENLDTTENIFKKAWEKSYYYTDGNLAEYKLKNIKNPNLTQPIMVRYKYNSNNLPIERVEFLPERSFVDSVKFLWKFDEGNKLISHSSYIYEGSVATSENLTNYNYNSSEKLSSEIEIEKYENDQYPLKDERIYYYNSSEFLDSIKYLSKIIKGEIDSLIGYDNLAFEYDSSGYNIGYTSFATYKNDISGARTTFTRDKFHNIIFVQVEQWKENKWVPERNTRIVYKRKEY